MAPLSPSHRPGCARLGIARLKAFRLNVYESFVSGIVNGVPVGGAAGTGLRIEGASVEQIINDPVDTATFRTRGFTPVAGQVIDVYGGDRDEAQRLFGGRILATTQVYESRKQNLAHEIRCVDPTWLLNRRMVLFSYRAQTVTTIVLSLARDFARGITTNHVQTIGTVIDEITFTNEAVPVCLTALAERVGAHWYLDYHNDLHFFTSETPDANAITDAQPHGAAGLQLTEDLSQVVTKVIGRGGGARAAVDTPVGAIELPVDEGVDETWYAATGGFVEVGPQKLQYAGVRGRGGRGAYVGVGNAPSGTPVPTPASGSSHTIGATYGYAVSYTSASGETPAGPIGSITIQNLPFVAPPACSARSRGPGTYPPGLTAPGTTSIRFRVQIQYHQGSGYAFGPLGAISASYVWDGYDWEIYFGPIQTVGSGYYYPTLEPGGFVAPVYRVLVYRSDNLGAFNYEGDSSYPSTNAGWYTRICTSYSTGGTIAPSSFGSVNVTAIPIGTAAGITGRKLYRTTANGSALKLLTTIANNSATTFADTVADGALGAAPPTTDTSGVQDQGQVLPGSTTLPVSTTQPFSDDGGASGGWVRIGDMPVQYSGIGTGVLTGIPASGNGSITAATRYGTQVLVQPRLYGIIPAPYFPGSIAFPITRGDAVTIRIEMISTVARDLMATRLATPGVAVNPEDGIIELVVSDARFGLEELQAHVLATLEERKDPHYTLTFTSRDHSLQVGRLVAVNTTQPPINRTFRIQKITLSEIAIAGGRGTAHPLKTVEATSQIYKFTDLLRRLRSMESGVR